MITQARIREEIQPIEGLGWITALRAPAIRQLVEAGKIQFSLFDESQAQGGRLLGAPRTQRDLAEIQSPDYPGEPGLHGRNASGRYRMSASSCARTL